MEEEEVEQEEEEEQQAGGAEFEEYPTVGTLPSTERLVPNDKAYSVGIGHGALTLARRAI